MKEKQKMLSYFHDAMHTQKKWAIKIIIIIKTYYHQCSATRMMRFPEKCRGNAPSKCSSSPRALPGWSHRWWRPSLRLRSASSWRRAARAPSPRVVMAFSLREAACEAGAPSGRARPSTHPIRGADRRAHPSACKTEELSWPLQGPRLTFRTCRAPVSFTQRVLVDRRAGRRRPRLREKYSRCSFSFAPINTQK